MLTGVTFQNGGIIVVVLMYSFSDVAVTGGTRNGRGSGQLSL